MLDFLFEANLWHSPTSGAADILSAGVPLATETNAQRIAQGSGGSCSLCVRAVDPPGERKSRSSVLPGARPLLRRALLHRPGRSLLGEEVGRRPASLLGLLALEYECLDAEHGGGCAPD